MARPRAAAEVHVVYSARDLARQIPAAWQESIKHQRKQGFGGFLNRSGPRRTKPNLWFCAAFDLPDVLARWSKRPAPRARPPRHRPAGRRRRARRAVAALLPGVRHRPAPGPPSRATARTSRSAPPRPGLLRRLNRRIDAGRPPSEEYAG